MTPVSFTGGAHLDFVGSTLAFHRSVDPVFRGGPGIVAAHVVRQSTVGGQARPVAGRGYLPDSAPPEVLDAEQFRGPKVGAGNDL
jgi:hypothetical protein